MKLTLILEDHKLLDTPTMTVGELAKKHGVSEKEIEAQVKKGIEHEKEHASDPKVVREIALDHLKEDLKYYDKLEKAIPEK